MYVQLPVPWLANRNSFITSFFSGSSARKRPRTVSDEAVHYHSDSVNDSSDSEQDDAPSDTSGPDCDDANEDLEINSESHGSNSTTAQNDELGSSCSSECCRDGLSEPYHPTNILLSKKRQGKQSRTFQRGWFVEYKWLTYCET